MTDQAFPNAPLGAPTPPDQTAQETLIPPGWTRQQHPETFAWHAGPFYYNQNGAPGVGFVAQPHHANLGKMVHGGALLTLADMALFTICFREVGAFKGVTVSLNTDFLAPGKIGAFISATGEPVRIGKSLMVARGLIESEGVTLMSFSGTLKRFAP